MNRSGQQSGTATAAHWAGRGPRRKPGKAVQQRRSLRGKNEGERVAARSRTNSTIRNGADGLHSSYDPAGLSLASGLIPGAPFALVLGPPAQPPTNTPPVRRIRKKKSGHADMSLTSGPPISQALESFIMQPASAFCFVQVAARPLVFPPWLLGFFLSEYVHMYLPYCLSILSFPPSTYLG